MLLNSLSRRLIVVMTAMGAWNVPTRADILIRGDGQLFDGKAVSQNEKEVVFQPDGSPPEVTVHFDRRDVAKILITGEHGALISDSAAPATRPAASRWNVPADPTAPPVNAPGTKPTYLVIPLHGEVGETVLASALEKSLEDAVLRKPNVVVLDIDSPGGLVEEAKQIIGVLHHYNKKLRIVALTNQTLSAAAILSLSVREIYVKPSSTIGAATSFVPDNLMLPPKIEEKMQSAWRAVARNSAEEGGHQPLLAEAMIDSDRELHLDTIDGKPVVKEGPGENVLCRKGKILTLTSHEAVACGLAAGEADDLAELGTALKLDNWTEIKGLGTLLGESLPKRVEAFKASQKEIDTRFQQDLTAAVSVDPSQSVTTVTRVTPVGPQGVRPGGPIYPGRFPMRPYAPQQQQVVTVTREQSTARWNSDSLACVAALQKVEIDLKDACELSVAYGRGSEVAMLKEVADKFASIRAAVFDNRNKYGRRPVFAVKPPANPIPVPNPNQGRTPTTNPAGLATLAYPAGTVKTPEIGGAGGANYFPIFHGEAKPLIGFRYKLNAVGSKQVMQRLIPVIVPRTAPLAADYHEVIAKEGYVVGGLVVDADENNVVAVRIIFVGYKDGQGIPRDTYESDWLGEPDTNATKTLGGKDDVAIAAFGRRNTNVISIGLALRGRGQSDKADAPKP